MTDLIPKDYTVLLNDIKKRVRSAQYEALNADTNPLRYLLIKIPLRNLAEHPPLQRKITMLRRDNSDWTDFHRYDLSVRIRVIRAICVLSYGICVYQRSSAVNKKWHACWKTCGGWGGIMSFPMVALGKVVRYHNAFIQIDDLKSYKRCRVQLHAQGIVLRDIVSGAEIRTKKQQVCRPEEFLVAEIDTKIGGFGIVPPELDGAIVSSHYFLFVSSHYFLFVIDETRLDRRFLDFFIRTPYFREQVTAQGSTNYAAIRPADVLGYRIPLLPLPEQRSIVAYLDSLQAKVNELRRLQAETSAELDALLPTVLDIAFKSELEVPR